MNSLLHDTTNNTLERFESYSGRDGNYDKKVDDVIKSYFPTVTYIKPLDYCPRVGVQDLDELRQMNDYDPIGYCSYWSSWYLDYRLSNPDYSREQLIKSFTDVVLYNKIHNKSQPACTTIDNYMYSFSRHTFNSK